MNTALSGSGRIDDLQSRPEGEIRGQTKLVKITEDVRKYAAEHGLTNAEAIESGMEEKRKEFVEQGSEVYTR
jgi:phosphomethylpyrimidine synthase